MFFSALLRKDSTRHHFHSTTMKNSVNKPLSWGFAFGLVFIPISPFLLFFCFSVYVRDFYVPALVDAYEKETSKVLEMRKP
jgi:hypothetical protein